ncbi:hypothetical protein ACQ4M3_26665 [Leptolyngbya sp. AN03gr2]
MLWKTYASIPRYRRHDRVLIVDRSMISEIALSFPKMSIAQ